MTRKTAECYDAVYKYIEENIFQLERDQFMTDYEEGMRSAISNHWKGVEIRGCWFHLCRALWRRACKLGMSRKYLQKNSDAMQILKRLMCLPLVPANRIDEGFRTIKSFARKKKLSTRYSKFFVYFERYWLNYQVCSNIQRTQYEWHERAHFSFVAKLWLTKNEVIFLCFYYFVVRFILFVRYRPYK